MLTLTCFAAVGGRAVDLIGLRPVLIASCSIFAIASLAAGYANGAVMLISMRIVQGLCAAIIYPLALAAVTLTFDEDERGWAPGTLIGMVTIFLAAGPLVGGLFINLPGNSRHDGALLLIRVIGAGER